MSDEIPKRRHDSRTSTIFGRVARFLELLPKVEKDVHRRAHAEDEKPWSYVYDPNEKSGDRRSGGRQIHDYPEKYPQCCVQYTNWKNTDVKAMFHYLREAEYTLQSELVRRREELEANEILGRLRAVEGLLIWMTASLKNV